jgi:RND superfamily putative drug exporter
VFRTGSDGTVNGMTWSPLRSATPVLTTTPSASRGPTVRIARWSATHPWRAVTIWLALVVSCIAIGQAFSLRQISDTDTASGQSKQALQMLNGAHLRDPATETVLITSRHGALRAGEAKAAAADVTRRMRTLPAVAAVDAPVTSADRSAVMVQVTMAGDPDKAGDHVDSLLAATAAAQRDHADLRVEQVGGASLDNAVNTQVSKDLGAAATFSLPVTLLILLVAFGAIVAAGVPVLLALSAVGAATGLSSLVSHVLPDSGSTSSMILLMGMAVGVDYSLFYVKRVRAERHRGRGRLDAIEIAAATAGHSVLVSGLSVIVSMLGLFLARDAAFSSLAAGSIVVVAVAVVGSLTVLPALIMLLGRGIDRPRVPVLWRLSAQVREPVLWPRLLKPALTHPGRTLIASVLVLLAMAAPAIGLRLHSDTAASLPDSIGEKAAFTRLTAAFPSQQTTQTIVVRAPATEASAVVDRLTGLARQAADNPLFLPSDSSAQIRASADATVHRLDLDTSSDPESGPAKQDVRLLRGDLVPRALAGLSDVHWAVAGDTAENMDTDRHLSDAIGWVVGFVVALTMLVMGWVFRSVVIAATTALVNLLSAGAAFGVLVLTFQHTWAERLLGFHSTGAVINWIPLFTFAVLFGLSMDYHVFVVSRIREAAATGLSTREAVRVGITESAGTVTSAAIVMVSVFSIFASLHMVEMKELGVGLAVAVLVDALLVRIVVLPAAMTLLGRWNWWPGRLPAATRAAQESTTERVLVG